MKVNEKLLKVSAGQIVLDGELNLGDDVIIRIDGTVTKTEDHDNQDGTVNRVFTVKGTIADILNAEGKKITREEVERYR